MEITTQQEQTNAIIPAGNLPALREKIAKLNRKAKRLGCEPVILWVGERTQAEKTQFVRTAEGDTIERRVRVNAYPVVLTGQTPILAGNFALVARIQLLDGVSIAHTVPGETLPAELHQCTNRCDHCGVNRFRNDVFVVRSADGAAVKVVGRTCVADFLGGISPARLAWYAESLHSLDLREFEDYQGGFAGTRYDLDVERYLGCAAAAIRLFGWTSKKQAEQGGIATAAVASEIYWSGKVGKEIVTPTPQDEAEAAAAIAWAGTLEGTTNDYLVNVHKVAALSYMPANLTGIAASIISAHQRELGRTATATIARRDSQHVAAKGERITRRLTIERTHSFPTAYGETTVHNMKDEDGNVFVWFSTRGGLDQGRTYEVTGTVKEHGDFRGVKQTVLTRCRAA